MAKEKKSKHAKTELSPIVSIGGALLELGMNKSLMKAICGSYSDGTQRSLVDSLNGEVLSPKDKEKYIYKKKKKSGKKKGKKKKSKIKL